MFQSWPLLPVNVTLFGSRIFVDITKLRWLEITGLVWVVSNLMTRVLIKRRKIKHRPFTACEDGGRDWCDMSASQEHQGVPATTKGLEGSSPTALGESTPCQTLHFGCPASRTVRERMSIVPSLWFFMTVALEKEYPSLTSASPSCHCSSHAPAFQYIHTHTHTHTHTHIHF